MIPLEGVLLCRTIRVRGVSRELLRRTIKTQNKPPWIGAHRAIHSMRHFHRMVVPSVMNLVYVASK